MAFKLIKPDSIDQQVAGFSVFLAGSIDNGTASLWGDAVTEMVKDLDVTVFNPRNDNWNSFLEPRMREPAFAKQVNWELDLINSADIVFFYFEPNSKSPITLQELGYAIGRKSAQLVVCCPDGFWRKGNVEVMCFRSNIPVYETLDEAVSTLRSSIETFIFEKSVNRFHSPADFAIGGYQLVNTCGACPEQYYVWEGERQVGYLRLRHGFFTVDYPDVGGQLVYEASTIGDGIFDSDVERETHLRAAIRAIHNAHAQNGAFKNV